MADSTQKEIDNLVDHLFRTEYGKMVSFLVSKFGFNQLGTAEDLAQETITHAFSHWSFNGVPENPQAWLFTVARNKALNYIKRQETGMRAMEQDAYLKESFEKPDEDFDQTIQDSMLRMIFACCHPKIKQENQIPLVLKTLCGFSRREIAHAILTSEENIKKRLYRAKKMIKDENIQLEAPLINEINSRVGPVCSALYLLFNEGYNSTHSKDLIRKDLCLEAMRLTKILSKEVEDKRPLALFALMCFHIARFESRLDDQGAIILFQDQDRTLWNKELIAAGQQCLYQAGKGKMISGYHIEASIAAIHCSAESFEKTDWKAIHSLYTKLYAIKKNPIILLNLAIVSAKIEGTKAAIEVIENLKSDYEQLEKYYLLYATLGEFYREIGNNESAMVNFKKAIDLTDSQTEQNLLNEKLQNLN